MHAPRFVRLDEKDRERIAFSIDGKPALALAGDTLLVAILTNRSKLRRSEFAAEVRSGFCLMAACQDCWVWTDDGERIRACDTPVRAGISISTEPLDASWPNHAS